jgi:serpin B
VLEEATNNKGGGQPLFVGNVYHKAVIEVNEEGTETAGSTAVTNERACAAPGLRPRRPKPVDFVADHPFAFFVV